MTRDHLCNFINPLIFMQLDQLSIVTMWRRGLAPALHLK